MKVILEPRQGGKTTRLIEWSSRASGRLLVCPNLREASRVFHEALRLKRAITFPITADEFFRGEFNARAFRELGVDNLDMVLEGISPLTISVVSITREDDE